MRNASRAIASICLLLFATVWQGWCSAATAAASAGEATADSSRAAASPSSLRGTAEPLSRHVSPVRHLARGALFIPYAGLQVIGWPVGQTLRFEARHRVLQHVSALLTGKSGPTATRVSPLIAFESSTGLSLLGLNISSDDWLGTKTRFHASAGYVSSSSNRFLLRLRSRPASLEVGIEARFKNKRDRAFYGLGPHSRDVRFGADQRRAILEATASYRPHRLVRSSLAAYAKNSDLDPPTNDRPVTESFPEAAAVAERSRYVGLEASVAFDSRDAGAQSTRGMLLRLTAGVDDARSSGDGDYRHYGAEAQGFVNLYRHTRVLALRAFARGIDAPVPESVPYTELERVGGKTGLRGYSRRRFTDRNALVLTVEYRYRLTNRFQGRLFGEWGSVAPEWSRLRLADIDPIFGAAMAVGGSGAPLSLHAAWSREGIELFVGTGSVFSDRSRRRG